MSEYVVTLNGSKKNVKINPGNKISVEKKNYSYEISKINDYSYILKIDDKVYEICATRQSAEKYGFLIEGNYFETSVRTKLQEKANELLKKKGALLHHDSIKAPMPGLVLKIKKKVGEEVNQGEPLVILEAMKMENEIRSPSTGKIKEIMVKEGSSVEKEQVILTIE